LDRAHLIFDRVMGDANHLGLFAEQTSAKGEALGNFPQGLTHLSFITAACELDGALGALRMGRTRPERAV
ncbi:MAG: hypothetical protein KIT58_13550, partial [Planctomycetota bacterium]|nr:hypothetical protein [Planctomycetota bacterium]